VIIIAVLRALIRLFISDAHELEGGLIDTTPLAIRLTTTHLIFMPAKQGRIQILIYYSPLQLQ
jgi:hypothetical protein